MKDEQKLRIARVIKEAEKKEFIDNLTIYERLAYEAGYYEGNSNCQRDAFWILAIGAIIYSCFKFFVMVG